MEESAAIEDLGDGWFKCTIQAKVNTNNIRIIFGSTTIDKSIGGWEGVTDKITEVLIVPSSISLQEIIK